MQSAAGTGTKRKKARSNGPSVRKRKHAARPGGKGKILVMDDEEFVGSVIRLILGRSGYDTCIAGNGDEAIKKFRAAKDLQKPFDAVILDLNIPVGMEGSEAMEKLRGMDPEVKAVLLTGDITHPTVARYAECGFKAVLLKPFTGDELMQAIQCAITE
jgi:CheY-like chemotaxis protein